MYVRCERGAVCDGRSKRVLLWTNHRHSRLKKENRKTHGCVHCESEPSEMEDECGNFQVVHECETVGDACRGPVRELRSTTQK